MIVCKSRGFIFLRVPRTASTSLSLHIINNIEMGSDDFYTKFGKVSEHNIDDAIFADDTHANLEHLEQTLPHFNLNDYLVYGVLRNPIDRFLSLFSQLFTIYPIVDVKKLNREQIAKRAFDILFSAKTPYHYEIKSFDDGSFSAFPLLPQSHWLIHKNKPINRIITYPNFKNLLIETTGNDNLIYHLNPTSSINQSNLKKEIIETIRYFYPTDFRLWEHVTGEAL